MPAIPEYSHTELESICGVLADTSKGLTGSEIGSILARLGIPDPMPTMTKRHRLYEALAKRQAQFRSGNIVGAFIEEAMNPVRYTGNRVLFDSRRMLSISEMGHFLNRTLWRGQAALTSSLKPWL